MTRTERSAFPRAILKDRSESRSGLDKSLRKNGGGHHNWGNLADDVDAAYDEDDVLESASTDDSARSVSSEESAEVKKSPVLGPNDVENAREFRKTALKGQQIDLSEIARTSSAVSPTIPSKPFSLPNTD